MLPSGVGCQQVAIGKKSARWNRKLKGWWLLGGAIGFVATLLIAYRIALWFLMALIAVRLSIRDHFPPFSQGRRNIESRLTLKIRSSI